jgi:hypothetical protein
MTEGLVVALFLAASGEQPDLTATALARLRARVAVDLIEAGALAGRYQVPPVGLGGLAGDELHLFPDGTYVYCEWADVEPLTVHDKGQWRSSGGLLALTSDADITWDPGAERQYIVVRRTSQQGEALLIGVQRHLRILEQVEDMNDDQLLWLSLSRSGMYKDLRVAARTKAKLMREAWRPESFRGAR